MILGLIFTIIYIITSIGIAAYAYDQAEKAKDAAKRANKKKKPRNRIKNDGTTPPYLEFNDIGYNSPIDVWFGINRIVPTLASSPKTESAIISSDGKEQDVVRVYDIALGEGDFENITLNDIYLNDRVVSGLNLEVVNQKLQHPEFKRVRSTAKNISIQGGSAKLEALTPEETERVTLGKLYHYNFRIGDRVQPYTEEYTYYTTETDRYGGTYQQAHTGTREAFNYNYNNYNFLSPITDWVNLFDFPEDVVENYLQRDGKPSLSLTFNFEINALYRSSSTVALMSRQFDIYENIRCLDEDNGVLYESGFNIDKPATYLFSNVGLDSRPLDISGEFSAASRSPLILRKTSTLNLTDDIIQRTKKIEVKFISTGNIESDVFKIRDSNDYFSSQDVTLIETVLEFNDDALPKGQKLKPPSADLSGVTILRLKHTINSLKPIYEKDLVIKIRTQRKINYMYGNDTHYGVDSNTYNIAQHLINQWGLKGNVSELIDLRFGRGSEDTFNGELEYNKDRSEILNDLLSGTPVAVDTVKDGTIVFRSDHEYKAPKKLVTTQLLTGDPKYSVGDLENDGIEIPYTTVEGEDKRIILTYDNDIFYNQENNKWEISGVEPRRLISPHRITHYGILGRQRALKRGWEIIRRLKYRRFGVEFELENDDLNIYLNESLMVHTGLRAPVGTVVAPISEGNGKVKIRCSFELEDDGTPIILSGENTEPIIIENPEIENGALVLSGSVVGSNSDDRYILYGTNKIFQDAQVVQDSLDNFNKFTVLGSIYSGEKVKITAAYDHPDVYLRGLPTTQIKDIFENLMSLNESMIALNLEYTNFPDEFDIYYIQIFKPLEDAITSLNEEYTNFPNQFNN